MYKKISVVFLIVLLTFVLTACNGENEREVAENVFAHVEIEIASEEYDFDFDNDEGEIRIGFSFNIEREELLDGVSLVVELNGERGTYDIEENSELVLLVSENKGYDLNFVRLVWESENTVLTKELDFRSNFEAVEVDNVGGGDDENGDDPADDDPSGDDPADDDPADDDPSGDDPADDDPSGDEPEDENENEIIVMDGGRRLYTNADRNIIDVKEEVKVLTTGTEEDGDLGTPIDEEIVFSVWISETIDAKELEVWSAPLISMDPDTYEVVEQSVSLTATGNQEEGMNEYTFAVKGEDVRYSALYITTIVTTENEKHIHVLDVRMSFWDESRKNTFFRNELVVVEKTAEFWKIQTIINSFHPIELISLEDPRTGENIENARDFNTFYNGSRYIITFKIDPIEYSSYNILFENVMLEKNGEVFNDDGSEKPWILKSETIELGDNPDYEITNKSEFTVDENHFLEIMFSFEMNNVEEIIVEINGVSYYYNQRNWNFDGMALETDIPLSNEEGGHFIVIDKIIIQKTHGGEYYIEETAEMFYFVYDGEYILNNYILGNAYDNEYWILFFVNRTGDLFDVISIDVEIFSENESVVKTFESAGTNNDFEAISLNQLYGLHPEFETEDTISFTVKTITVLVGGEERTYGVEERIVPLKEAETE